MRKWNLTTKKLPKDSTKVRDVARGPRGNFWTFSDFFCCLNFDQKPQNRVKTSIYSPLQRNPFFCILPYKMAMFTIEKNHLNIVEKLSFCHHLFVLMWGVSQWVLAAKFSAVSKLFNFENCVILAHIRFNLKLSSLDIFESFDSASGSWLSDLSNDVSIIFQFWLLSELCQIFKC